MPPEPFPAESSRTGSVLSRVQLVPLNTSLDRWVSSSCWHREQGRSQDPTRARGARLRSSPPVGWPAGSLCSSSGSSLLAGA